MKRKLLLAGIVLIGLVLLWRYFHKAPAPAMPTVVVQVAPVQTKLLQSSIKAIGTINAASVEITPETAGHIASIAFNDGAVVKQGDTLIQLDDAILKAKLASMTAQYQFSLQSYSRLKKLASKGIVAQQALDEASADMKEKKAALDEASVTDAKMKLVAPFDGMVGQRKVNVGDYVNPGQGVVTLTDTEHLRVEYNLPEKYLSTVQIGQTVEITTAAYSGKTFTGTITYISPTINPENRTIAVYAALAENHDRLASGLFVGVTQTLSEAKEALVVPARSLVPVLNGNQVYKVVNGKAVSVDVQIGTRTENTVEITHGLKAGDQVVTDGQIKLRNGQPITTQLG
ncbi:MAG TPA: efflux RND transporter periplasmic adaptor subunit [Gammaproteobacteria bacterium]|nr:efflux RND transporter periplasmic adaptor subunit [Gammaproteobacteria bacterium]